MYIYITHVVIEIDRSAFGLSYLDSKIDQMDKYSKDFNEYEITVECVPLILEAFKSGTRFAVSNDAWEGIETGQTFFCRHYDEDGMNYVKVTNDERRRMIPILNELSKKTTRKKSKKF
jgi:hypothetical protein